MSSGLASNQCGQSSGWSRASPSRWLGPSSHHTDNLLQHPRENSCMISRLVKSILFINISCFLLILKIYNFAQGYTEKGLYRNLLHQTVHSNCRARPMIATNQLLRSYLATKKHLTCSWLLTAPVLAVTAGSFFEVSCSSSRIGDQWSLACCIHECS